MATYSAVTLLFNKVHILDKRNLGTFEALKPYVSDVGEIRDYLQQPVAEQHRLSPLVADELFDDRFVYAVDGYDDQPVLTKAIAMMTEAESIRGSAENNGWFYFWTDVFGFFSMREEFSHRYVVYSRF